jgi:NAD dependent epimerase/dehydratase family enzyme
MSDIITKGRRVLSEKIEKTGFEFKYKDLETALRNCLDK